MTKAQIDKALKKIRQENAIQPEQEQGHLHEEDIEYLNESPY